MGSNKLINGTLGYNLHIIFKENNGTHDKMSEVIMVIFEGERKRPYLICKYIIFMQLTFLQ